MKKQMKIVSWGLVLISAIIAGSALYVIDTKMNLIIQPEKIEQVPALFNTEMQMSEIKIRSKKLNLKGHYCKVDNSELVVLIAHNGKGNLYDRTSLYQCWKDLNVSILAFDYQGFGLSEGEEMTEEDLIFNALSAHKALKRFHWTSDQVLLYGQGVGATILANVARKKGCAGWIAENALPSMSSVESCFFSKLMLQGQYDLRKILVDAKCPKLFVHGSDNNQIPVGVVREMIDNVSNKWSLKIITGGDHRSLAKTYPDQWKKAITEFLDKIHGTKYNRFRKD